MKKCQLQSSQGFTLIELMIVVAIIGVISALAVPQYRLFTNRAYVTAEAISAARPYQTAISEYYLIKQRFPPDVASLQLGSLPGTTASIQSVTVASDGTGKLTVLFDDSYEEVPAQVHGLTLVLEPVIDSTTTKGVIWTASEADSTLPNEYLPRL